MKQVMNNGSEADALFEAAYPDFDSEPTTEELTADAASRERAVARIIEAAKYYAKIFASDESYMREFRNDNFRAHTMCLRYGRAAVSAALAAFLADGTTSEITFDVLDAS